MRGHGRGNVSYYVSYYHINKKNHYQVGIEILNGFMPELIIQLHYLLYSSQKHIPGLACCSLLLVLVLIFFFLFVPLQQKPPMRYRTRQHCRRLLIPVIWNIQQQQQKEHFGLPPGHMAGCIGRSGEWTLQICLELSQFFDRHESWFTVGVVSFCVLLAYGCYYPQGPCELLNCLLCCWWSFQTMKNVVLE